MDVSPYQPKMKAFFILAIAIVVAIYLGVIIGEADYQPLLFGVAAIIVCYLWFFTGRYFWLLAIASNFFGGVFPILRGQFTPFHILMAMGLAKFLVEDVILRRTRLKMPGRFDLFMIVGFMSIILFHGVRDRFGMRFLGSTIWGGRHYVSVFVGLLAFFVIQSIPMKRGLWGKFPYLVLAIAGFDLLIGVITSIAPGTIYVIYPFYSAVSMTGLQEIIGGPSDVTGRIGSFGNFGLMLMTFVFATASVQQFLHPSNFFRWIQFAFASLCVLISGYRSFVINAIITVALAGIRDLKIAALAVLPILAAGLFALSIVNSEIVTLPKQVQRGLSFLPGQWSYEQAQDAKASNDFRRTVWTLWWRHYFPDHPMIGRGFGFKSEWTKKSIWYGNATDYQQMVETGNIHMGFFATLDCVGIIGTIFFVAWNVVLLKRALQVSFDRRRGDHLALRFVALYLSASIVFYWIGATSVGSFLPGEFAMAGLFLRLRRDLLADEPKRAKQHVEPAPRQFRRELARN